MSTDGLFCKSDNKLCCGSETARRFTQAIADCNIQTRIVNIIVKFNDTHGLAATAERLAELKQSAAFCCTACQAVRRQKSMLICVIDFRVLPSISRGA